MTEMRPNRQWTRLLTDDAWWWIRLFPRGYETFSGGKRGTMFAEIFASDEEAAERAQTLIVERLESGHRVDAAKAQRQPRSRGILSARRDAWLAFDPAFRGGVEVEDAIFKHDVAALRLLFQGGVAPDVRCIDEDFEVHHAEPPSEPALNAALFSGTPEMVTAFFDAGLDLRKVETPGSLPPPCAAIGNQSGHAVALVELLLARGADPNAADPEGKRALHHAARWPVGWRVITELVKAGADGSVVDRSGRTALHDALLQGFGLADTVRALLDGGVPVDARDDKGLSALDYCRQLALHSNARAWKGTIELLVARGAAPSRADPKEAL